MRLRAKPGQLIVVETRNAGDFEVTLDKQWKEPQPAGSAVHPITGPIHIEGAKAGDALAVTLIDVSPGPLGYSLVSSIGFVSDLFEPGYKMVWRLNDEFAASDDLPGVRIPNAGFPGIITTLPSPRQHAEFVTREAELRQAGGAAAPPEPAHASPANLCGAQGTKRDECIRTFPPREHGGNMDIRYLKAGVTVYLPCYVEGCGLGLGDLHYAQGDGEVSGTAIEMDATVTLRTRVVRDMPLPRGPHYEGPAKLLDIPSRRFYATTGLPVKDAGSLPPDMRYLNPGDKAKELRNLSKDVSLAARNALLEMINYMVATKGLTREQAYILASVAVDLRIGQLVDAPNVGVTAILPLDIFVEH
jgi:formamidase